MFQINMKHHTGAKQWRVLSALLMTSALFFTQQASAAQAFSLQEIIALANQQNPSINIAKAQQDAAIARVTTATAYLNPEVEASMGPSRYRSGSNETKKNWAVALSQPIEFSALRGARRSLADSGVKVAGVGLELSQIELKSRVKSAFYDVLQREAVLTIVEGDRNLLKQIRDKVKSRVEVGEAPKYELIKADTETLAAERDYQAATVRVIEAKAYLRGFIGLAMPMDYDLKGLLPLNKMLPSLVFMREQLNQSPQLVQIRAAAETADANLNLEQRLRAPGVTLKAGVEQDPDLTSLRFGLAIPLPLWSQRQGQIAEAAAGVSQVQALLSDKEFILKRDLESSYQRYLIAQQQVGAFENGLLNQAESLLKVTEAAYRYGERGILEYLDAQRTYRAVRKDYLAAKYDYVTAMLEIERLLGIELLEGNKE